MIKLRSNVKKYLPVYQTAASAGCDVKAKKSITILPHQTVIVPTGLYIDSWLPLGFNQIPELQMRLRSSLAIKHNLCIPNGVGTIDADYPGEIGIIIHNLGPKLYQIQKEDRVGQLVLNYVRRVEGATILDDEREGGYGSTGK